MQIDIHPFAQGRHQRGTGLSYFEGTWGELVQLVQDHFADRAPGYRDGVVLVPVPPDRFVSGSVALEPGVRLSAAYEPRRPGEDPVVQVRAHAPQARAQAVDVVLYSHATLAEDGDASGDADWEIVSVNARPTVEPEPMDPVAMARNQLGLPGGTTATYTPEQWAQAVWYAATHAHPAPEDV